MLEEKLQARKQSIKHALLTERPKRETIDVTLPGKRALRGHRHPNQIALEDLERVFIGMGYEVVEGPEVEYDRYNFELLNIPANHPAKDEQDTFYITKDILLRTQTSSVQARIMEQGKLPIKITDSDTADGLYVHGSDSNVPASLCHTNAVLSGSCVAVVQYAYAPANQITESARTPGSADENDGTERFHLPLQKAGVGQDRFRQYQHGVFHPYICRKHDSDTSRLERNSRIRSPRVVLEDERAIQRIRFRT